MSWWIVDFKSINENGTEGLCDIECDTAASLPAADQTLTAGIKIVRGSKALDLSTGDRYKMNSSGSWVQQPSEYSLDLTGYATQSWVNGELAGYVLTTTYNTDQAAQDNQINRLTNESAKNHLRITATSPQTINGVTFTVNSDQSISLSGTATATTTFLIVDNASANLIPDGSYILTGCPSGGGSTTYDLRWYLYSPGRSAYDQGSGASVNKSGGTTSSNIAILIRSGVNTDGVIFRPMLRYSTISDNTFVPYAPTNRELYEMILALQ